MARQGFSWGFPLCLFVLVVGLLSLGVMAIQGPAYRMGWWGLRSVFGTAYPLTFALGGAAVAVGIITLLLRFRHRFAGVFLAVVGILAGVGGASVPLMMRQTASEVPRIHDITTNTLDPPSFVAVAPLRADAPNPLSYAGEEVAVQQREAYPDLQTIRIRQPADKVFEAALAVANKQGWEIHAQDPEEGRIEATEETRWFGFKDDVVIRIRPEESVTNVDVRSKSRVGQSDLGVNAQRIRIFRDELLGSLQ